MTSVISLRIRVSFYPRLIERCVFHAFAALNKVTVNGVQRSIACLNDRGVMKLAVGLVFEMASPLPTFAFVVGNRDREAMASGRRVVVDEEPMAVAQADRVQARTGIGQFGHADGAPRQTI